MIDPQLVLEQYGREDLRGRVQTEMERAGLGPGTLRWSDLAPIDEFHVRGLAATLDLAAGLGLELGDSVLDVGCGLGGPARYLAAVHGCQVTGIDLSQPFIDVAEMLTQRTDLSPVVSFVQGNALALPFESESFDHAWTQHVAMNIADRRTFYQNIHRVLKPGGRLAIYDVLAGNGEPLTYPVPWARDPKVSYLLNLDEMRQTLKAAGFEEISWEDTTAKAIQWFSEQLASMKASPPTRFNLAVIMGSEFAGMAANLAQNLREGRARLVQMIVHRM